MLLIEGTETLVGRRFGQLSDNLYGSRTISQPTKEMGSYMHIRAHIQPSRLLAGSVVEDLLQLLTAVVVPEAADTGCPLHVCFREAERTCFARSEFFRVRPGAATI